MAMLRLASSKVVPRTLRAIASPTILSGSNTIVERESYASQQSSFSTVADAQKRADKELAKVLKSKIRLAKLLDSEIRVPEAPTGFPFDIQDIPGEKLIKLTREFAGEKIEVFAQEAWNPEDKNVTSDISDEDDDSDDENSPRSLFCVKISGKNRKPSLEVSCLASVDSIGIRSIEIYGSAHVKGSSLVFDDLEGGRDRDLEEYWRKFYLGSRGIDDSLGRFVLDYMIRKSRRDHLHFLNKFRKFVKG